MQLIIDFNVKNLYKSIKWFFEREEFTNYMYDISPLNRNQMVGAVSQISGLSISEVEIYFIELEQDIEFSNKLELKSKKLKRSYEFLYPIPYARRLVWYALIRIYKPKNVVESGTEKGLGSLIIARALEKNGFGELSTLDIDIYSGGLIDQDDVLINLVIGDSIKSLSKLKNIDFFIQDSDHSINHERLELEALEGRLNPGAIVISDNAHDSNVLFEWSKKNKRKYLFIPEKSIKHWHSGDGVGVSI
jgi:predicted O-methyltransferase YrrM